MFATASVQAQEAADTNPPPAAKAEAPAVDAPAATDDAADPQDAVVASEKSIGGMIVSGGVLNVVFFGILGVFSLWAATVVLERIVHLRRDKLLPESFARQLSQIVEVPQTSPVKFQQLCEGPPSPASRIFHAGVLRAGRSVPEVEKAMEDAASRETATLRARSRPLSVVGNIAPLVGLLGTVVGMILAFQISSQEGLGKAERLAEGIYLALMTTAAGLTIAIPCLLFATWFHSRAERYMCDIDECLMESIPSFARMEGQPPATAATPVTMAAEMTPRERFLHEGVTGTVQG
jgi:biopolymer transport protein ExbB